ncbi:hypothetical protein ACJMK2_024728 [Sinanodonta woodiana]|uniref:Neural cell adhesion molecule 1-like n=1 Tax=Sinanodonta woodiana TaxID=1069815 RepID=A0ABD3XGP2_SINWO
MGRLHILSITLLFVLDVLFAQDGTVIATSVIRITGKDEQEETRNGYLKCEVTEPTVGTNYNLKWYDPNGQYVRFQGETNSSLRLFASRDSSTNYISLNFMPVREFDAGLYTCTATINGQLRNETFKITTYRGITFSNCPLEQKIISGSAQQTVLCSASAGGIDLTTYWKRQDQSFLIQAGGNKYAITSAGLIIFNVSEADEKVYEFNAKYDKTFAWEFQSITVKVLVKPVIVYPPTISTAKAGDKFSMLCRANGKPDPKYDWYKEGTANQWSLLRTFDRIFIDEVHGELRIDPLRKDDEGQYKCQASNEAGSAEAQARLDVQVPPDIIEIRNATGEENGGAVITCRASGDPAPEMKWKPINSDNFYQEGQNGDISVTLTKDQVNRESTLLLKFTNLKPSHMGDYTCQAHNNAGDDIGYGHLNVRYAAKFNNQPTGPFYNWYGNEKGNVTCVVNGNPLPVVQWFKGGNQITGQTSTEDKDKFQVTSILSARMDLSNEQQILGDYICQGLNAAGVNNITIRMVRAEKPPAPGVSVDQFTARIIRLVIVTPTVRGPPVSKFVIKYKVQGSNENPVTIETPPEWRNYVDDQPVPRTYKNLENLAVKTNYIITVTAVNDVGESAPFEFTQTTRPYSVPQSVKITSPFQDSLSPTSFLLMWDKPEDGGSEIQKYILNYREVEILPNRTLYELSKPLSGFINVDEIPPSAVRYQLSSLVPGTYYQVEILAVNTQGSSPPTSYIFKTKEVNSTQESDGQIDTLSEEVGKDGGLSIGAVIGIVVAIFFLLFVIVDVTCYFKNKCGILMCIKEGVTGTKSEEPLTEKKMEEGGDVEESQPLNTGEADGAEDEGVEAKENIIMTEEKMPPPEDEEVKPADAGDAGDEMRDRTDEVNKEDSNKDDKEFSEEKSKKGTYDKEGKDKEVNE